MFMIGLGVSLLAGCGSDGPSLVPVTGTLTYNGEPMAGAEVSFAPDAGNPVDTPGIDVTGPDGTFSAKYRNRKGLAPGKYKVLVRKVEIDETANVPPELKDDPEMARLAGLTKDVVPDEYADLKDTHFTLEVSDSGESDLVFDVKGPKK